ncbi:hypothetical protein GGR50DRAFT_692340 [Xylaria sp. CBS 124048]|nr:hypothetical protein GGR50DRAFT_692340 [Xylaria sp. CBS 124048]
MPDTGGNSTAVQGHLRPAMPETGMRYRSKDHLTYDPEDENSIAAALKVAGCDITSTADVSKHLAQIFKKATPFMSLVTRQHMSLSQTLPWVQGEFAWARLVSENSFFELFVCLIAARHEGLKTLAPEADKTGGNVLVKAIDCFRRGVNDCPEEGEIVSEGYTSWILAAAEAHYQLIGDRNLAMGENRGGSEMGPVDEEMTGCEDNADVENLEGEVAAVTSSVEQMEI